MSFANSSFACGIVRVGSASLSSRGTGAMGKVCVSPLSTPLIGHQSPGHQPPPPLPSDPLRSHLIKLCHHGTFAPEESCVACALVTGVWMKLLLGAASRQLQTASPSAMTYAVASWCNCCAQVVLELGVKNCEESHTTLICNNSSTKIPEDDSFLIPVVTS